MICPICNSKLINESLVNSYCPIGAASANYTHYRLYKSAASPGFFIYYNDIEFNYYEKTKTLTFFNKLTYISISIEISDNPLPIIQKLLKYKLFL